MWPGLAPLATAALTGLIIRGILPALLAPLAVVPLLLFVGRCRSPFRSGLACFAANLGLLVATFEGALPVMPWAFLPAILVAGVQAFSAGWLATTLGRRLPFTVLSIFPALWALTELIASRRQLWGQLTSPVSSGYLLVDSPLAPVAATAGTFGLSFLLFAAGNLLALPFLILSNRRSRNYLRPQAVRVALAALLPLALIGASLGLPATALVAAGQQVHEFPPHFTGRAASSTTLSVSLVQPALDARLPGLALNHPAVEEALLREYRQLLRASAPADLVLLPEGALTPPMLESLASAGVVGESLIAGAVTSSGNDRYNSALQLEAGEVVAQYDKIALVPFGERALTPGDRLVVGSLAGLDLGVLICLDSLYPDLTRQATLAGAGLLAVISDDSFAGRFATAHLHLLATRARALETGRHVLFVSAWGPSAVISPRGELIAVSSAFSQEVLKARLPVESNDTIYSRWGDTVVLTLVALGLSPLLGSAGAKPRQT